jgi:hypothetical protein
MMRPPHDTESEKNICSAAFLQTVISRSFSHFGTKKYLKKIFFFFGNKILSKYLKKIQ